MGSDEERSDPQSGMEPLEGWPYKSNFQQAPVDHFSKERLPVRSRRKAIGLALGLGLWGVQRFYLRRPALGVVAFALTKIGLILGVILFFFGFWLPGAIVLVGLGLISILIGIVDAIALASGAIKTDGLGKPLDP